MLVQFWKLKIKHPQDSLLLRTDFWGLFQIFKNLKRLTLFIYFLDHLYKPLDFDRDGGNYYFQTEPDNDFFGGKIILNSIFKDFSDEEKYQNEFLKLLDKYIKEKQQKIGGNWL